MGSGDIDHADADFIADGAPSLLVTESRGHQVFLLPLYGFAGMNRASKKRGFPGCPTHHFPCTGRALRRSFSRFCQGSRASSPLSSLISTNRSPIMVAGFPSPVCQRFISLLAGSYMPSPLPLNPNQYLPLLSSRKQRHQECQLFQLRVFIDAVKEPVRGIVPEKTCAVAAAKNPKGSPAKTGSGSSIWKPSKR